MALTGARVRVYGKLMMAKRHNWLVEIFTGAWSIVQGLAVTLRNCRAAARHGELPGEAGPRSSPRWRGRLMHLRDEEGRLKCTACLACQKACPTLALPHIEGDEKKGRERRVKSYVWDAGRCLFCNLCVEACPFDAIALEPDYSIVGETPEGHAAAHWIELLEACPPTAGGRA